MANKLFSAVSKWIQSSSPLIRYNQSILCSRGLTKKGVRQVAALKEEYSVRRTPEEGIDNKNDKVVLTDDGGLIICWHPEVQHPYEMSRPVPEHTVVTQSNLKIQALQPVSEVFRQKHDRMMVRELMHLTYTTKHKWFGKYGKEKRQMYRERDPLKQRRNRDYL